MPEKNNQWKNLNPASEAGCEVPPLETAGLCYPKSEVTIRTYRKLRNNDLCNPTPTDPCVMGTDGLVLPEAELIDRISPQDYKQLTNQPVTVSCETLYAKDDIYRQYGNYNKEGFTGGSTVTIEAGTYIQYVPTSILKDDEDAILEQLNALAYAQGVLQANCYLVNAQYTVHCPVVVQHEQLSEPDRITVEAGAFSVYKNTDDDTWLNAYEQLNTSVYSAAVTQLTCTYGNAQQIRRCRYAFYQDPASKLYYIGGFSAGNTGIPYTELNRQDFDIRYALDTASNQLIPGYYRTAGAAFTPYTLVSLAGFTKIDNPETLTDDTGRLLTSIDKYAYVDNNSNPVTVLKNTYTSKLTKSSQDFLDSGKSIYLYLEEKAKEAAESADALALSLAISSHICMWYNPEYTASCPEGYFLDMTDDASSSTVIMEAGRFLSYESYYDAAVQAKTTADAMLTGCKLQNVQVKFFCDYTTALEDAINSGDLADESEADEDHYFYQASSAALTGGVDTHGSPIYIYVNHFTDCTDNCLAVENYSRSSYTVDAGLYTTTSTDDTATNVQRRLNAQAIAIAKSSLSCVYGNTRSPGFTCSDTVTRFGVTIPAVCAKIDYTTCRSTGGGLMPCAYAIDAPDVEQNSFTAETPEKANSLALAFQQASIVCLRCDLVGGGGGGSLSTNTTTSCSSCANDYCVFT